MVVNHIRILDFLFSNHLSTDSMHLRHLKEQGPAVCQVIMTSLSYSFVRYNHRLSDFTSSQLNFSPTLCETFAATVSACSLSLSLSLSLTGENYTVSLSSAERARQTIYSPSSAISDSGKPASIFRYLASPSGEISNAVQKYYVNRLLRLILTGRKIKQWTDFSSGWFISSKRWGQFGPFC